MSPKPPAALSAQDICQKIHEANQEIIQSATCLEGVELTERQQEELLIIACKRGYLPILQQLASEYGLALLNKPLQQGTTTALEQATKAGHSRVIRTLLEHGVIPQANTQGQYPLHYAITHKKASVVKVLYRLQQENLKKESLNNLSWEEYKSHLSVDIDGYSPLDLAMDLEKPETFLVLYKLHSPAKKISALKSLIIRFKNIQISKPFLDDCLEAFFRDGDIKSLKYLAYELDFKELLINGKRPGVLAITCNRWELFEWIHKEQWTNIDDYNLNNLAAIAIQDDHLSLARQLIKVLARDEDEYNYYLRTLKFITPLIKKNEHAFLKLINTPEETTQYYSIFLVQAYLRKIGKKIISPLVKIELNTRDVLSFYIAVHTGQIEIINLILKGHNFLFHPLFTDKIEICNYFFKCAAANEQISVIKYLGEIGTATDLIEFGFTEHFKELTLNFFKGLTLNFVDRPLEFSDIVYQYIDIACTTALTYGNITAIQWLLQEPKIHAIIPKEEIQPKINNIISSEHYFVNLIKLTPIPNKDRVLDGLEAYVRENSLNLPYSFPEIYEQTKNMLLQKDDIDVLMWFVQRGYVQLEDLLEEFFTTPSLFFGYRSKKILYWLTSNRNQHDVNFKWGGAIINSCLKYLIEDSKILSNTLYNAIMELLFDVLNSRLKSKLISSSNFVELLKEIGKPHPLFYHTYESLLDKERDNKETYGQMLLLYLELNFESAAKFAWQHQNYALLAKHVFSLEKPKQLSSATVIELAYQIRLLADGYYYLEEGNSPLNDLPDEGFLLRSKLQALYLYQKILNNPKQTKELAFNINWNRHQRNLKEIIPDIQEFCNLNYGFKATFYFLKYCVFKLNASNQAANLSVLSRCIDDLFDKLYNITALEKLTEESFTKDNESNVNKHSSPNLKLESNEVSELPQEIKINTTLSLEIDDISRLWAPSKYFEIFTRKGEEAALVWYHKHCKAEKGFAEQFPQAYQILLNGMLSHEEFSLALDAYLAVDPEQALIFYIQFEQYEFVEQWCFKHLADPTSISEIAIEKLLELLSLGEGPFYEQASPLNSLKDNLPLKRAIQGLYLLDELHTLNAKKEEDYFTPLRARFSRILSVNNSFTCGNSFQSWHPYAHLLLVQYQIYKLRNIPGLSQDLEMINYVQNLFENAIYAIKEHFVSLRPVANQAESSSSTLPFFSAIGKPHKGNASCSQAPAADFGPGLHRSRSFSW